MPGIELLERSNSVAPEADRQLQNEFDVIIAQNYPNSNPLPDNLSLQLEHESGPRFLNADDIAWLVAERAAGRDEAARDLEQKRQSLREGNYTGPLPVDALGTAKRVVEIRRLFGRGSKEDIEISGGLLTDCVRLLAEAGSKNGSEYFDELVIKYIREIQDFIAHGQRMSKVVGAGLSPIAAPEEVGFRVDDVVEERTYRTIGGLALQQEVAAYTILPCPDWVIKAYKAGVKSGFGGYVPEIEKLMLRGVRVAAGGHERYEEQLSMPGKLINTTIMNRVLQRMGVIKEGEFLNKAEIHGTQIVTFDEFGVIALAKMLDEEASREAGEPVFLGEHIKPGEIRDYSTIKQEAAERQQRLIPLPQQLADYIISLEESGVDREAAVGIVEAHVQKIMLGIARKNPAQAELIFDHDTAAGMRKVAWLEANGFYDEAMRVLDKVERGAPQAMFCGAGSCGLEAVAALSKEAKKAAGLGLEGKQLHDKVRACKACNSLTVHYDSKGNKACTNCEYKEINGTISKPLRVVSKKENKGGGKLAPIRLLGEHRERKFASQALAQAA